MSEDFDEDPGVDVSVIALRVAEIRERVYAAVADYIQASGVDDDEDIWIDHGGVRTFIRAGQPDVDVESAYVFASALVTVAAPSKTLFRWVATRASSIRFGQFGAHVQPDGSVAVRLTHTLLAHGVTDEMLRATLLPLISCAPDLSAEATQLFGPSLVSLRRP